ncbi:MAG TPA: hypothetical protein PKX86_02730, partial [Bacteroidia bacterium]|nr:hypothetical protein [Bacteroidia bacterium]
FKNLLVIIKRLKSILQNLVVNDLDIAKNVIDAFEFEGKVETEFEIHRVSSSMYDLEPQN